MLHRFMICLWLCPKGLFDRHAPIVPLGENRPGTEMFGCFVREDDTAGYRANDNIDFFILEFFREALT